MPDLNNCNTPKNLYRRRKNKRVPLATILLGVGFLGFAAFVLIYTLSDSDSALHNDIAYTPTVTAPPTATETPTAPEEYTEAEIPAPLGIQGEEEQENIDAEQYTIINMNASDISRGNLILINHDHAYDIPDDIDLYRIADTGATSIRLQVQGFQLIRSIIEPLDNMMTDYISETGDRTVTVIAAWRSHETQRTMRERHGEAAALPGHSEHHAGLAFDFGIFIGETRSMFRGTGTTAWFEQNSYRYGFILRYPADKTHITEIQHEPWHFRYAGLPHSYIMFQNNWVLEEYIDMLREYTYEEPFTAEFDGIAYEIYFAADTEVSVPVDAQHEISGNNVDGFIVTVSRP